MEAKERAESGLPGAKPLLMVDIDGVISLFGFPAHSTPQGSFHAIDGIPHFLSTTASHHLLALVSLFELVWASGWEEKANEHLPHLLGLPRGMPFLSFGSETAGLSGMGGVHGMGSTRAHWKLDAIDTHAGPRRPLAWIDDAFNPACHEWAATRPAPTLLLQTEPHIGLTQPQAAQLTAWAGSVAVTEWAQSGAVTKGGSHSAAAESQ